MLGKLLLGSPDLLLLDEPTNHLDIATTEWLEGYLVKQESAMIIVSHDRYFLDKTVNAIWEMHSGKMTEFSGNYAAYQKQRNERQLAAERVRTKQEEAIAHNVDFVRRNLSGQLAKQAKSREKMIERLQSELVETVADIRGPLFTFGEATRAGDIVVSANDLAKQFDDLVLFKNATFEIERGERVGITAPMVRAKLLCSRSCSIKSRPHQARSNWGMASRLAISIRTSPSLISRRPRSKRSDHHTALARGLRFFARSSCTLWD